MGWSCAVLAAKSLDRVTEYCLKSTGIQNVVRVKGIEYLIERSSREHPDGEITGTIYKMVTRDQVRKCGSFKIDGSGNLVRGPSWMREAIGKPADKNSVEIGKIANPPGMPEEFALIKVWDGTGIAVRRSVEELVKIAQERGFTLVN